MVKKVNLKTAKNVPIKSRHIEWNWEISPDNSKKIRYHFIVVGDKRREGIIEQILEPLQEIGEGIEQVRNIGERVAGSDFRYLFRSYDSPVAPEVLDLSKLSLPKIRNKELYERKGSEGIEIYVADRFEV